MSCAGRLPIFVLLAGAFFPHNSALALLGIYFLGVLLAILSAVVLSRFIKEDDLPFVMELPPYRVPTGKAIWRHTWEKGKQYLQKMSGTILICSVVIWALGYFPRHDEYQTVAEQQEHSYIGYVGKAIEPVLSPLGFDWKMGVGIIAGIGAKELVVSTLGVMYASGEDPVGNTGAVPEAAGETAIETAGKVATDTVPEVVAEGIDNDNGGDSQGTARTPLQSALLKAVTPAGALAYMVFILLYFPCVATLVAISQESGGKKWAVITAVYTLALAWLAAFVTFKIFSLLL